MSSRTSDSIRQAIQHIQSGNLSEAEPLLAQAIHAEPGNFDALHIMGIVHVLQNRPAEAAVFLDKAVRQNPDSGLARYNLAVALAATGHDAESLPHHERAVALSPGNHDAWVNYGKSLAKLKRHDEALACYNKALALHPAHAEALGNQGALLAEMGRHEAALTCFRKALAINPSHAPLCLNLARTLHHLKRHEEALAHYDQAIRLEPGNMDLWHDKGRVLHTLKRHDEALAHYDRFIRQAPDSADPWYAKGNVLNDIRRYDEALACFDKAFELNPDHGFLYGDRLSAKMSVCDWNDADAQFQELEDRIQRLEKVAAPFTVLSIIDSPALQRKTADRYASHFPANPSLGAIAQRPHGGKIRIGYFSNDFHDHATAFLTAELFEMHDREKFELFAFSFGPDRNDRMRKRLQPSFDEFLDVRNRSDEAIARLSRERGIDIAVDLQGYQTHHRTGIFAFRAAPVQVNYLAYPGTMGAEYIDYLIADRTLIPTEHQSHYSEKIAYLPNAYQPNDRKRAISDRTFTREEFGLPQNEFVFCCFNNHYKITHRTFDAWMELLRETGNSVLWLLEDNPTATNNLRKEAGRRGVSGDRLVFARFMPLSDHLARLKLADLFLDTLPYNAHTTASDALWTGLPVLTQIGKSFPGRVAASLLKAARLPELVTDSQESFVKTGIELAGDVGKMSAVRKKLTDSRLTVPLFDTPLYARHLEAAFVAMHERHQAGMTPDHIYVA